MLKKIWEFFSNLFGNLFGSKTKTVKKTRPRVQETEDLPQDGSEIQPDTTVVVYNEQEEIIPDVAQPEIESSAPQSTTTENSGTNPSSGQTTAQSPGGTTTTAETANQAPEVITGQNTQTTGLPEPATNHKPRYLWCLDNGHGKKTAGKRSPELENGERFYEYEFNRDIVQRIIQKLEPAGVAFFNVVPEIDVDNILEERVQRANNKRSEIPKIYVSVHSNAAPAPVGKWASDSINGIETWFFHGSRKGKKAASIFQKHLIKATGWKSRNIKSQAERQFFVLRNTNMTAVLTENGFYNNKNQCQELLKEEIRAKIADAHVAAILEIEKKGLQ